VELTKFRVLQTRHSKVKQSKNGKRQRALSIQVNVAKRSPSPMSLNVSAGVTAVMKLVAIFARADWSVIGETQSP